MEWRASHILIKDRKLADEILKRLRKGGNFSALAKEHSTCPSKAGKKTIMTMIAITEIPATDAIKRIFFSIQLLFRV